MTGSRSRRSASRHSSARFYRDRRVMVTGGMGFIGSNLARRLVELGARRAARRLDDPRLRRQHVQPPRRRRRGPRINIADVRQRSTMNQLVREVDVIFNLAGQVSHIDSMQDPHTDLDINCRAQLSLLEACRHHNPGVKVVFAGTRQIYGRPERLPVDETHLVRPDRRERHQQGRRRELPPGLQQRVRRPRLLAAADQRLRTAPAAEAQPAGLHRLVHPAGDRGPRDPDLRRRRADRDFVFVDDAADAFLRAGATDACNGSVFNIGGSEPISHVQLVELLVARGRLGPLSTGRLARRQEGHRHRRLLRGLVAHAARPRAGAPTTPLRDGPGTHAAISTARTSSTTFPPRRRWARRDRQRAHSLRRTAARTRSRRRSPRRSSAW